MASGGGENEAARRDGLWSAGAADGRDGRGRGAGRYARAVPLLLVLGWVMALGPGCLGWHPKPEVPMVRVQGACQGAMKLTLPRLGVTLIGVQHGDCVELERIEDGEGAYAYCPDTDLYSDPARYATERDHTFCKRELEITQ